MKPHIYKVGGRWFCRVDHPRNRILSAGWSTPKEAYEDLHRRRKRYIFPKWKPEP